MKAREARELGARIAALVRDGRIARATALLAPVLAQRTPFDKLRLIGGPVGAEALEPANAFMASIARGKTEGGWVVICKALERQLDRDITGAFARCHAYVMAADVWYGADILGEGLIGEALIAYFEPALDLVRGWRQDDNPWVRRAIGIGVHYWAKRSAGASGLRPRAMSLLGLLEPLFEERETTVVRGVGWGLETLGKHYPDLVTDWLVEQVVHRRRPHRAVMLRKATVGLSDAQRAKIGDPCDSTSTSTVPGRS
jgi:hypothetical protein